MLEEERDSYQGVRSGHTIVSDFLIMSNLFTSACRVNKLCSETGLLQYFSVVFLTQVGCLVLVYSAKILLYLKYLWW